MKRSETIKELALALSKAQAEIRPAEFDAWNPHFKSRYATLQSIVAASKDALSHHNLSVLQSVQKAGDEMVVITTLLHSSGEWVEDEGVPLILDKKNMQGLGSAFTYARRYGMASMLRVVADEDDDGNAAVIPAKLDTATEVKPKQPEDPIDPVELARVQRMKNLMTHNGWSKEKLTVHFRDLFGKPYKDLTGEEKDLGIEKMNWNPPEDKI